MKLTTTQKNLLIVASEYTSPKCPIKYDTLKSLCECKSFDSTFNVLVSKGYFERVETNDYSNQFIRTDKSI